MLERLNSKQYVKTNKGFAEFTIAICIAILLGYPIVSLLWPYYPLALDIPSSIYFFLEAVKVAIESY